MFHAMEIRVIAYTSPNSGLTSKRRCRGRAFCGERGCGEIRHSPPTWATAAVHRTVGSKPAIGPLGSGRATLDKPLDVNDHSFVRALKSHPSVLAKRFRIQDELLGRGKPEPRPLSRVPRLLFLFLILTYFSRVRFGS